MISCWTGAILKLGNIGWYVVVLFLYPPYHMNHIYLSQISLRLIRFKTIIFRLDFFRYQKLSSYFSRSKQIISILFYCGKFIESVINPNLTFDNIS